MVIATHGLLSKEPRYRHREDEECRAVLCSLVAACAEQTEEVTSILLSLCKRGRPVNEEPSEAMDDGGSNRRLTVRVPGWLQEVELPPPFSDGPSERVDETIQSVLLDSGTLNLHRSKITFPINCTISGAVLSCSSSHRGTCPSRVAPTAFRHQLP